MLTLAQLIYTYLLMVPVFFGIDMVWLGLVAKNFYREQLGDLLAKNINWPAAIVFYLAFIFGILYFAVLPAVESSSVGKALLNGVLFGGLAYATYDLTNLATTEGWPAKLVPIDVMWGTILAALTACAGYYIAQWLV